MQAGPLTGGVVGSDDDVGSLVGLSVDGIGDIVGDFEPSAIIFTSAQLKNSVFAGANK